MENEQQELPLQESLSSSASVGVSALLSAGGNIRALSRVPKSSLSPPQRTLRTESYSDTSESRPRANHVSGSVSHAGAASSATKSVKETTPVSEPSRGTVLDTQVELTSPKGITDNAQTESEFKESAKETGGTNEATENMCMAEPQEQKQESTMAKKKSSSKKVYEVPLTILPKESSAPKRKKQTKPGQSLGRWTHEEHQAFLEGLQVFGREWKKLAEQIPTRTSAQIRSHAQKYFSKLAREEAILTHESTIRSAVAPQEQPTQQLSASVQRTAERIMANPSTVEREVEDTLRQLRQRYRQLQIRLEQSQRARGMPPMDPIVEDGPSDHDAVVHQGGYAPGLDRRKRTLEEAHLHQHNDDGASSVSSDLSHSLASLSPSREFGDEELIALDVLGGTLPRSASGTELHAHESSFSEPPQESEAKRPRLGDDCNNQSADGDDKEPDEDGDETMI